MCSLLHKCRGLGFTSASAPLPRLWVRRRSGFYNLTRQLGGTFGIAVLTVVLDHQRAVHRAQLVEHLATTNPLLQERLQLLSGLGRGEGGEVALQILSLQVDRQAALLAYGDVFRVVGLVFLLAIPLVLLLGKPGEPEFSGAPH